VVVVVGIVVDGVVIVVNVSNVVPEVISDIAGELAVDAAAVVLMILLFSDVGVVGQTSIMMYRIRSIFKTSVMKFYLCAQVHSQHNIFT
jgi:hypothetical protein